MNKGLFLYGEVSYLLPKSNKTKKQFWKFLRLCQLFCFVLFLKCHFDASNWSVVVSSLWLGCTPFLALCNSVLKIPKSFFKY